jgi:hypothetical protein
MAAYEGYRAHSGQRREVSPVVRLQRTIANQAAQRHAQADHLEIGSGTTAAALDYDSHDNFSQDFYEFKTRYQYLPYEQLGAAWFATSGMVAQAHDQKATMLLCGYYGELVWVFDNEDVANAARPYLQSPDAADRVIAQTWASTRPAPSRRGR